MLKLTKGGLDSNNYMAIIALYAKCNSIRGFWIFFKKHRGYNGRVGEGGFEFQMNSRTLQ
jgi:hypothetical protein